MKLFAGLSRTDYQDLFRAIGAIVDEHGLQDIRLWEHAEGIVLQGRRPGTGDGGYETLLLPEADLLSMLRGAYDRREQTAGAE